MKNQHTPGPWRRGGQSITADGILTGAWKEIATVRIGSRNNWHDPEGDANARLVASSPELLDALRYMIENAEAAGWSEMMLFDARSAVARARGQA